MRQCIERHGTHSACVGAVSSRKAGGGARGNHDTTHIAKIGTRTAGRIEVSAHPVPEDADLDKNKTKPLTSRPRRSYQRTGLVSALGIARAVEVSRMRIKFWGVRGSIPVPGPDTLGVGGNTSCVEVQCDSTLVVLDGGTGIRLLGLELLKKMPVEAHIFFSHVHWDHIHGFPFFTPGFIPGNRFHLYGGTNVTFTLERALAGQMENPSFPVLLSDMAAQMHFHNLTEGQVVTIEHEHEQDHVHITNARGNHPNGVFAYRVDHAGRSAVFCTDTEHYDVVDPNLARLTDGADVLIYDAMYLPEEYSGEVGGGPKTGWGHSTYEHGVRLAREANVKQLVLFHHDPTHTDAIVAAMEKRAQAMFPACIAAREGLVIDL